MEEIMGNDPRKRQKKLERRASKRKEKKHVRGREQNAGLAERLRSAAKFPILHCWIGNSIAERGIGWVVLSRAMPNGSVATASFLVDSYCLGVKEVFVEILPRSAYDSKYLRKMMSDIPSRSVAPTEARKLLEEAVAYAHELGFSPHPDYPRAMILFGDIEAADSDAHFEFGKDGKPFFVSGPNDSPERCKQIVAILNKTCGPGQFDYFVAVGSSQIMLAGPNAGEEDIDEIEDLDDEER
jgi:hypothetical protein